MKMVQKLLEKAPITFILVRLLSWMDPRQMAMKEKENNNKKLKKTLAIMVDHGREEESKYDSITQQYARLCDKIQEDVEIRETFSDFDSGKDRLDTIPLCVERQKRVSRALGCC